VPGTEDHLNQVRSLISLTRPRRHREPPGWLLFQAWLKAPAPSAAPVPAGGPRRSMRAFRRRN